MTFDLTTFSISSLLISLIFLNRLLIKLISEITSLELFFESSVLFLISTFWVSTFSSKDFVTASRTESNASSVFSSYSILFVSAELVSGFFSFSSFTFLLIFSSKSSSDFSCL